MKRSLYTSLLLLLLFVSSENCFADQKVLRVSDGRTITFAEMIDDLKKAPIVFVGEVHDMPEHHQAELDIIKALHDSEKPTAVGLEMFRANSQAELDSWVYGKLSVEEFLPVYYDNWRMPWPLYRDIFLYARDYQLPLRGLNIPDAISKKIAERGFASLTADEQKQLPPGISCNVDPTYMDFIKRAYAGHHGKDREFANFCEAQMVWDKSMAWNLRGYLKKHPDKTIVVLAGVGHAWKRGIAEQLEDPTYSYRVVLPAIPGEESRETVTAQDADYLLLQ